MPPDPERKQVDLYRLPAWARWLLVVSTIALVVGLALIFGKPHNGPLIPASAIVGALIAFGFVAWNAQRR
jgi:hypothetical protein